LAWTLLSLTRHLFRQKAARILLVCFALTLLWIQSPHILGSSVNRVFLGAGTIQASWPRWVVYAWLILATMNLDAVRLSTLLRVPHPLESKSRWFWIRSIWETLVLWCCAELLIFGISSGKGAWFHVEPNQVLTNLLLALVATVLWVFLAGFLRNRLLVLLAWVLSVGLIELRVLNLSEGWIQSQFGVGALLVVLGVAIAVNSFWNSRCKSQS
jgi:hypothetical protein